MIKAVLLDVGGTLIEPFPSVGHVYAAVAARHNVDCSPDELQQKFASVWGEHKRKDRGVDKDWWRSVVWTIFDRLDFNDPDHFFEDLYAAFAQKNAWRIFPDVVETLSKLRQENIRLAVASNWDERLPALLQALGLNGYFERQYISAQLGFAKPDVRFFRHILDDMKLDPLEVIHIGDDEEEDVKGAESAGIRAYSLDRNKRPLNSRMMNALTDALWRI